VIKSLKSLVVCNRRVLEKKFEYEGQEVGASGGQKGMGMRKGRDELDSRIDGRS
jgi:hypothetical protein